ncbi:SNF2 family N-terminal domain-containing protein [Pisolithus croceorrhizus]|nr:SNF2 family N-terminal domain-containing protein [Pisolithus croceorrhizus]
MSNKALFFAGSDDETDPPPANGAASDANMSRPSPPLDSRSGSPAIPTVPEKRLFLVGSDEEDAPHSAERAPGRIILHDNRADHLSSDAELPCLEEVPRTSSVSSISSQLSDTRLSPTASSSRAPPLKKQRLASPKNSYHPLGMKDAYIGCIVGNAWSTAKGKGYINPGDEILVERDALEDKTGRVKGRNKAAGDKGKKKQLTLKAMMNPQPSKKFSKRKVDAVIRLTNKAGFEFGRLPQDLSVWISKLLDLNMITFKGSTMIDCPTVLHSGADLVVSLSVYIRASAFNPPSTSGIDTSKIFGLGQDTEEEIVLRERKAALLTLFDMLNLRPRRGAQVLRDRYVSSSGSESRSERSDGKKKVKTEIVGDGEEVEVEDGEELSDDDLQLIYRKAQRNDQALGEMDPPPTFSLTLRGYQKQALLWMHSMESGEKSARDATCMHPLWTEYVFPAEPREGLIDLTEDEQPFYFNPYSGELSLEFPKSELKLKGGILADGKMGMGKTIMLSALIHANKDPEPVRPEDEGKKARQLKLGSAFGAVSNNDQRQQSKFGSSATLVVAPASLLLQWSSELQRSSVPGTLRVTIWHGQNRLELDALHEDDEGQKSIPVVITSYGVLVSEHAKFQKSNGQSSVFQIEWLRVILDEAHHCKSRTSRTARAVYALQARRRWAVTGTPIVNKLEDLYSLLKFLNFIPWSAYPFFRSFITVPFLAHDPKAIEIVQVILESVLLRREKSMRDSNGNRIVELPAKEVSIEKLQFTPAERIVYDSIYDAAKRNFDQLNAKGLVGKNYTHVLAMLMRLRRAVLHPSLVVNPEDDNQDASPKPNAVDLDMLISDVSKDSNCEGGSKNAFAENVLANLVNASEVECPICLDVVEKPLIIPRCMHQCCRDCIVGYLTACLERGEEGRCPTCSQGPVKEVELMEVVRSKIEPGEQQSSFFRTSREQVGVSLRRNDFRSSTKLDALLQNLRRLQDQDPHFRAIVFSQFTSFLSLISAALDRERLTWYRFDGTMDMKKRNAAITEFRQNERKPKILLISLKAGGVGLNLTAANHVFMMDCWWNTATEHQAIDRVHRLGQEKTVYVKHFIVEDTIEGRILEIQKRKTAIVKEAFRGTQQSGKSDPESIENLKVIFGDD